MNIGTTLCLTLAIVFAIFSVIFALLKEKGASLISGFNTLSNEEKEKYDKKKMSIDMKNSFLIWSIIILLGAFFSHFISGYFAIIAIAIWIILFFKDVHLDSKKAFRKYRKTS